MIRTAFADIKLTAWGCNVRFSTGQAVPAQHHPNNPHYIAVSHRLGYDGDTLAYCREHEVAHLVLEEVLHGRPSRVLWALAHGCPLDPVEAAYEELGAQALQGFVRARQRPFVGVQWDAMRERFLEVLDSRASA